MEAALDPALRREAASAAPAPRSAPALARARASGERCVLILSAHLPPSSVAGVHRARHLAAGLPAHGWRGVLVGARPDPGAPADPALAALVPPHVEQVRTGALPAGPCRAIGIGDIGLRGYAAFGRALLRGARLSGARTVLITGSPFYPMLLARRLVAAGLRVVLDFQDPWARESPPGPGAKAALSWHLAHALEPRALRHAHAVTSVSDEQNRQMRARHPWLDVPMAAVPIGGDPDDAAILGAHAPPRRAAGRAVLSYVGTFMPRSGAPMAALLRAARLVSERRPDLAFELRFTGTSNRAEAPGPGPVTALARALGAAHLVREAPARVSYAEALAHLAGADALLMVGSDEPHYTASKIYPNLMAGRPFVSLFHEASSAHAVLAGAGGGRALSFGAGEDPSARVPELADAIEAAAAGALSPPDPGACAPYAPEATAGRFAALFERIA